LNIKICYNIKHRKNKVRAKMMFSEGGAELRYWPKFRITELNLFPKVVGKVYYY